MSQVAIVTGAFDGIGRAISVRLASHPDTVVVCTDIQGADETAELVTAAGATGVARVLDVTDAAQWKRLVDDVVAEHGQVDYLAASAGVVNRISLDTVVDLTEEAWDHVLSVDAKGVWLGMQAVIPQMITQGAGHIVNISSLAASKGLQGLASYTAAKGAVEALTRQAAAEYGRRGVLVNAVAPGTIETTINAATLADPDGAAASIATTTIGRWGQPQELAAMVVALLRHGSFVSGQVLHVDGGWSVSGGIDYQDSRTM